MTTIQVLVDGQLRATILVDGEASPATDSEPLYLAGLVAPFLAHVDEQGKSASTVISYGQGLRAFAAWLKDNGNPALAELTPRHVADWKSHQQRVEKAQPDTMVSMLVSPK